LVFLGDVLAKKIDQSSAPSEHFLVRILSRSRFSVRPEKRQRIREPLHDPTEVFMLRQHHSERSLLSTKTSLKGREQYLFFFAEMDGQVHSQGTDHVLRRIKSR